MTELLGALDSRTPLELIGGGLIALFLIYGAIRFAMAWRQTGGR